MFAFSNASVPWCYCTLPLSLYANVLKKRQIEPSEYERYFSVSQVGSVSVVRGVTLVIVLFLFSLTKSRISESVAIVIR